MADAGIDKLAILGVGLIGGSLGLAVRQRGLARHVAAYSRTPATRTLALERGAADSTPATPEACVDGADLVYLATPVAAIVPTLVALAPRLRPGCVVTDAGSSKSEIVAAAEALALPGGFVGGHPMTGSELQGVEVARADLFSGMTYVLTPTDRTPPAALDRVAWLASAVGASVVRMPPEQHDRAVAAVSHLPHLLAAALMLLAEARSAAGEPVYELAAGSWQGATRVAASGATLWREILASNREAVLAALDELGGSLDRFRALLASGDDEGLEALLTLTRELKVAHPGRPG
ncbi:MAG: prephenate dehydrogenase/arogenate dehydrogenase family protein [Armatimonadetes bacterium]|nr:prephenate dehydrogenase/arogenate dehydrogenase family protein [Armatimonadota bacterium]